MPEKKDGQKTQLLTDAPPEVQAAIDRQGPRSGGGGQSTMLLGGGATPQTGQQRQVVVPTMMKDQPAGALPPMHQRRKKAWGRWVAGPLIAIGVAAGTAAVAGVVMPAKPKEVAPPPKVMGKLHLSTNPAGASITIDGKPFPHFTPTDVDGEVGATLKVGFKLDGYQSKEEEVVVASGDRPFSVKLDKIEAAPPAPAAPAAPVAAAPVAASSSHHDHHAGGKAPVEPAGKGTISVFVRPWAIVYVDGSRLRQTPVQSYEMASGKHTLELVNEGKGKHEKIPVTLKVGESQEIRRDWDK